MRTIEIKTTFFFYDVDFTFNYGRTFNHNWTNSELKDYLNYTLNENIGRNYNLSKITINIYSINSNIQSFQDFTFNFNSFENAKSFIETLNIV